MEVDEKPETASIEEEFINRLSLLNRGDMAALKRNAGNTIGESRGAVQTFYRILPPGVASKYNEEIYFLVATLYGLNKYRFTGDFGWTMRTVRKSSDLESVDKRMTILLDSDFDLIGGYQPGGGEMAYRLRQNVRLANSKEVGVDWLQLVKDLEYWTHSEKKVKKRWANSYFGFAPLQKNIKEKSQ